MRIAVIHSFHDRRSPSAENRVVEDQVAQLRAVGHEVELMAKYSDELAANHFLSVRTALNTATQGGADPSKQLVAFQPDVIHCHNLLPNWGTRWLGTWAGRTVATVHNYRGVCAAATMHRDGGHCQLCPQQSSLNAIKHRCYRGSALASAPMAYATRRSGSSQRLLNQARHLIFLDEEASSTMIGLLRRGGHSVIPNFVREPALNERPDDYHSGTWLFAGRLTHEKGILALLQIWPRELRLKVIGDGPLRNEVKAYVVKEPATFAYRGVIPRGELLRELDAAFALVVPSLSGRAMPDVVIDALACHTPVLLSQACGSRGVSAESGLISFDPHDRAHLAIQTSEVMSNYALLCKQAAARHSEHYSPQAWTNLMEAVYEGARRST